MLFNHQLGSSGFGSSTMTNQNINTTKLQSVLDSDRVCLVSRINLKGSIYIAKPFRKSEKPRFISDDWITNMIYDGYFLFSLSCD